MKAEKGPEIFQMIKENRIISTGYISLYYVERNVMSWIKSSWLYEQET